MLLLLIYPQKKSDDTNRAQQTEETCQSWRVKYWGILRVQSHSHPNGVVYSGRASRNSLVGIYFDFRSAKRENVVK